MTEQLEQQAREAVLHAIIAEAAALKTQIENFPGSSHTVDLRNLAEAYALVESGGELDSTE